MSENLNRFVSAQAGGVYERALAEVRQGRKVSHWMWFVFPQLIGLGHSPTARYYGVRGADEAKAYLAHPVLGSRLLECAQAVADSDARSAEALFGGIDAMKLRSSMTLFAHVGDAPVFDTVLAKYFEGRPDDVTLRLLRPV